MNEYELHICPLCHGTGIYEEKKAGGPNATEELRKVKCENCEGTGTIRDVRYNSLFLTRVFGKTPRIK